jgi:(p)ppGpp synthase/HD superfamily hydrolase
MEVIGKINKYFSETELKYLEKLPDNYVKALEIIHRVYKDKKDMSGNPEVGHFIRVSEMLETEDEEITGLLHDIVEDGYISLFDLLKIGFPEYIVDAVAIVSRNKLKYKNYVDYITSILESNNKLAIRVKYADMLDNSSCNRLDLLEESTRIRLKTKYEKQLPRIEEKLGELNLTKQIRERKII